MTYEKANQIIKSHESLVTAVTYNILFTNDLACGTIIEMMCQLRHSKIYRQRIKMLASVVDEHRHQYESFINRIICQSSVFFAEANDKFTELVQPHVEHLHDAIRKVFEDNHIENAEVLARMELARTMVGYACVQFDSRMKMLWNTDNQFRSFRIKYMRMTNVRTWMDKLMSATQIERQVDLNTPEVTEALRRLEKHLSSANHIVEAIKQ